MPTHRRLITRSDLDGIVSAALLKSAGEIDDILFAHPRDIQDGSLDVGPNDILTCLPPHPKASRIYAHRHSADDALCAPDHIICNTDAGSTSEVIYNYLGGADRFPFLSSQLLATTRAINTASLSKQDILTPSGWTMLGYLTDSRTGLGRYRRFRISNYQLMLELVDIIQQADSIDDILANPDVAERVEMYREHAQPARAQLVRLAQVAGPVVTLDMRHEREIFVTNRFTVYALFPQCALSLHILPGKQNQNAVFALGHSILARDRSAEDAGLIMRDYGGGGHPAMGACQVPHDRADQVKAELIARLSGITEMPVARPAVGEH